ncbi:hypothetical protein TSUD_287310 [Trifolium subterraneum]|uniref:Uncharacterized protein n=1 Tax=Trifolium subterraneum TaxID=3900 RepID=A0A2Z6NZ79_TRISU|nr:hypothetical protein TSUD_287310 [Trifolium subterraneum]
MIHLQPRTTINLLNKFSAAAENTTPPCFSNNHPSHVETNVDEDDADNDYINQNHVQFDHQDEDLYQDDNHSDDESNSDDQHDDLDQHEDQSDDESDIEVVAQNQADFQGM